MFLEEPIFVGSKERSEQFFMVNTSKNSSNWQMGSCIPVLNVTCTIATLVSLKIGNILASSSSSRLACTSV